MKYLLLQPDGMADEPQDSLGGKTPSEAARTPNLDALSGVGRRGFVRTIPQGFPPGSDIGNMVLLGYDPNEYFTGRAPLEAVAQGIPVGDNDVVYRMNLVQVADERMKDFTADHIGNDEAAELVAALNAAFGGDGMKMFPGVSYRNLMVWDRGPTKLRTTPPHDITGQAIEPHLPSGDREHEVRTLMQRSRDILAGHAVNAKRKTAGKGEATQVWLWGQGGKPRMPAMDKILGVKTGAMITAVDLLRGLGRLAGMEIRDVEGATGFVDTNYKGKADTAIAALDEVDFVFVHIEATDETAHMGRTDLKLRAIEDFDAQIAGPLLAAARQRGDTAVLCLPDHPTLLRTRTHNAAAVPFVAAYPDDLRRAPDGTGYSERWSKEIAPRWIEDGWTLTRRWIVGDI